MTQSSPSQATAALVPTAGRLDKTGAAASFLCAVHCALMPLIAGTLPLLGLNFLASEPVEWGLVVSSATFGIFAVWVGYSRHRSRKILFLLAIAILLLLTGRILEIHEFESQAPVVMVAGGMSMVVVHLLNRKLCAACGTCQSNAGGTHSPQAQ